MSKIIAAIGLCGVLFAASDMRADEVQAHFDGAWITVVSCSAATAALPYSYEFTSTVRDGVLHGERGVKGAPGWLQLDGRILMDGSADISAHGLVGKERYAVEERPPGTPYSYHIDATFSESTGVGDRVKGRACTVSFSRKSP